MALKIDKQEGSLSSLEEMRIHVVFQLADGETLGESNDAANLNEYIWVADAIGDLPITGDYVLLNEVPNVTNGGIQKDKYKVVSRSIDFGAFASNNQRIVCTIKVASAASL